MSTERSLQEQISSDCTQGAHGRCPEPECDCPCHAHIGRRSPQEQDARLRELSDAVGALDIARDAEDTYERVRRVRAAFVAFIGVFAPPPEKEPGQHFAGFQYATPEEALAKEGKAQRAAPAPRDEPDARLDALIADVVTVSWRGMPPDSAVATLRAYVLAQRAAPAPEWQQFLRNEGVNVTPAAPAVAPDIRTAFGAGWFACDSDADGEEREAEAFADWWRAYHVYQPATVAAVARPAAVRPADWQERYGDLKSEYRDAVEMMTEAPNDMVILRRLNSASAMLDAHVLGSPAVQPDAQPDPYDCSQWVLSDERPHPERFHPDSDVGPDDERYPNCGKFHVSPTEQIGLPQYGVAVQPDAPTPWTLRALAPWIMTQGYPMTANSLTAIADALERELAGLLPDGAQPQQESQL